jgi:hypothetical protein
MGLFEDDQPEQVREQPKPTRPAPSSSGPPVIGKFTEWVLLQCYRKTGRWPETFDMLFKEDVPAGLQERADALRSAYDPDKEAEAWLAEQAERSWT